MLCTARKWDKRWREKRIGLLVQFSERPGSLLLSLGVPSRPSPGSILGPSRSHPGSGRGPVQIRHVFCFTAFRTHPGPEVGAIPARPGPGRSFQDRAWTGRNRLLGHFRNSPCFGAVIACLPVLGPDLRNLFPLTAFKNDPKTPDLSKICPSDCFWGFQSGGQKFLKICQNLKTGNFQANFDKFSQIFDPLTGNPKNNRWDKVCGVVLRAVRGRRFRKARFSCLPVLGSFFIISRSHAFLKEFRSLPDCLDKRLPKHDLPIHGKKDVVART